jgi:hypothetical protein
LETEHIELGHLARANHSPNTLPISRETPAHSAKHLANFYKEVHQGIPEIEYDAIAEAILNNKLSISCEGQCTSTGHSTFSWAFHGATCIGKGVGSIQDGQASNYRAQLYSILASLLILKHVEAHREIKEGRAFVTSINQRALRTALKKGPIGVKSATQAEYDIVLSISDARAGLMTEVNPLWLENKSLATLTEDQQLNIKAHQTAISRLRQSNINHSISKRHVLSNIITVRSHGSVITSGLPEQIITNIHYHPLRGKIIKDKRWSIETFNLVDWRNFHKALTTVPRSHRVSLSKLCHGLWNTNIQNKRYYNHSGLCPICGTEDESLHHIFSCSHATAAKKRADALLSYKTTLETIRTPPETIECIINGITEGVRHECSSSKSSALTIIEKAATGAREQSGFIGWLSFLQGFISTAWKTCITDHRSQKPATPSPRTANTWAKAIIRANWQYCETIWAARNDIVHGKKTMVKDSKTIAQLKQRIRDLYRMYNKDKYFIPYTRS